MARRRVELRDQAILMAISGCEDLTVSPMHIEDDYLLREKMENRREMGLRVPKRFIPDLRTDFEKQVFKADKQMEQLEGDRANRKMDEYPGKEDEMPAPERKEMKLVDRKIGEVVFQTKINIQPIYSKDQDKWFVKITLGDKQDKVILVTARKDGHGTCMLTDWSDYMMQDMFPKPSKAVKI
jgi:hypothetical protein